jgi:glutathione peroxidase
MTAHDFSFPGIAGGEIRLADFAGRPLLLVNTASECGFTPQYAELQALWSRYRDRGLVVIGVPSNDFGAQEPDDEAAIKAFCSKGFGVDFPMTVKQTVIGGEAHPLYRWMVEELGEVAAPKWNFHKLLIAPDGSLAGLWASAVKPLDREITTTIDGLLDDAAR